MFCGPYDLKCFCNSPDITNWIDVCLRSTCSVRPSLLWTGHELMNAFAGRSTAASAGIFCKGILRASATGTGGEGGRPVSQLDQGTRRCIIIFRNDKKPDSMKNSNAHEIGSVLR